MKNPIRDLKGNLLLSRSGVVWATWRLASLSYPYKTDSEKQAVRDDHKTLYQAMRGEAIILGLCTELSPESIALKMEAGVDLDANPDWDEEIEATYHQLEGGMRPGERTFWLAVPLTTSNPWERATEKLYASVANVKEWAGLSRWVYTQEHIGRARTKAEQIFKEIPAAFSPRPATPAENVWIQEKMQQRGVGMPPVPRVLDPGEADPESGPVHNGLTIPMVNLDEGGQQDRSGGQLKAKIEKLSPWSHNYLRVQSEDMDEPSYQVLQVLSGVPKGGYEFPGVEWVAMLDQMTSGADFALRLNVSTAAAARRKNRGAEKNLLDQEDQRVDAASITGSGGELDDVGSLLSTYTSELSRTQSEVEVEVTAIFAVGGPTPQIAKDQADHIKAQYKKLDFNLSAPLGYQEALWWSMIPGTPKAAVVTEYAQIQTGAGFATSIALGDSNLGDSAGLAFADNITTAFRSLVFLDPAAPMETNASGCMGIAGELGVGKSVGQKVIAGAVKDMGGRVVALDRSANGEWEHFATSISNPAVASILDPKYSLDPLRIYPAGRASRAMQMFMGTLMNLPPMSPLGATLSAAIAPEYLEHYKITSSGKLLAHLKSAQCKLDHKNEIARIMDVIATKDYGRVIFDDTLPPLDINNRFIVFRTDGVELPKAEELNSSHRFEHMTLERKFGSSIYMLIFQIARLVCLEDRKDLAVFIVDEAHHLTGYPEGEDEVANFIRVSRRDLAFLVLGSHDPSVDFGSETLRGLITIRILMRHTSKELAKRGLEFLELNPEDPQLLEEVRTNLSPRNWRNPATDRLEVHPDRRGEAIMRDSSLRYGKIKIRVSAKPARAEASLTTPKQDQTARAA
ncbi:MAG: ATP-binding protein [Renibacterium salmoninarum]|nr:ATP-binding protein [Renibacterium salmoninarum]